MGAKKRSSVEEENPAIFGWSRWHLIADKDAKTKHHIWRVKRTRRLNGKLQSESIPRHQLKTYTNKEQLERFVKQLNIRYVSIQERAKDAYDFKHAFITETLIEQFGERVKSEVNKKAYAEWLMLIQKRNIHWFINKLGKVDPADWKRLEHKWGLALTCKLEGREADKLSFFEEPAHPDTIKKHIQVMNRFMLFVHERYPDMITALVFRPVSKAVMREYRFTYGSQGDDYVPGKFIEAADWEIMKEEVDEGIRPFMILQYDLGVRRTEAMALTEDDLWEDSVEISKQLLAIPDGKAMTGPPKGRRTRQVKYWFATPMQILAQVKKIKLMHPSTYSHKFYEEMDRLTEKYKRPFDYSTHDMRRTWITRAFDQNKVPTDIMDCAGHADLKTTLKYRRKSSKEGRKKFVPKLVEE